MTDPGSAPAPEKGKPEKRFKTDECLRCGHHVVDHDHGAREDWSCKYVLGDPCGCPSFVAPMLAPLYGTEGGAPEKEPEPPMRQEPHSAWCDQKVRPASCDCGVLQPRGQSAGEPERAALFKGLEVLSSELCQTQAYILRALERAGLVVALRGAWFDARKHTAEPCISGHKSDCLCNCHDRTESPDGGPIFGPEHATNKDCQRALIEEAEALRGAAPSAPEGSRADLEQAIKGEIAWAENQAERLRKAITHASELEQSQRIASKGEGRALAYEVMADRLRAALEGR